MVPVRPHARPTLRLRRESALLSSYPLPFVAARAVTAVCRDVNKSRFALLLLFPSLHRRRGAQARQRAASRERGVADQSIKCREACADREAGVVFRLRTQRKTTPGCVSFT